MESSNMVNKDALLKYISGKMRILEDDFIKLVKVDESGDHNGFYGVGLNEDGFPLGDCPEDIYEDGFENGVLQGEYTTLLMLSYLIKQGNVNL